MQGRIKKMPVKKGEGRKLISQKHTIKEENNTGALKYWGYNNQAERTPIKLVSSGQFHAM